MVEWQADFEFKKLDRIRIEGEGAQWVTEEGIKIGTTLEELVNINGKDFNFYGSFRYGARVKKLASGFLLPELLYMNLGVKRSCRSLKHSDWMCRLL